MDTSDLFRTDKTDTYGVTLDYTVPVQQRLSCRARVQLGYKLTKLKFDFTDGALAAATDPFSVSNTRDDTQDINAKTVLPAATRIYV